MAQLSSPQLQAQGAMHPVVQVALSAIVRGKHGLHLTESGKRRIVRALELSILNNDIVEGIRQLIGFAGYIDRDHGLTHVASALLKIALPWGPVLEKMAQDVQDPTGSQDAVRRIRRLANRLDHQQVIQAPMLNAPVPTGTLRKFQVHQPRILRL